MKIAQAELKKLLSGKIVLKPSESEDMVKVSGTIRASLAGVLGLDM